MIGAIHERVRSVITGASDISDETGQGLGMLEGELEAVAGDIPQLKAGFQWGFGQVIIRMGGMNDSRDVLIRAAGTPAKRAAYEQFEIAHDAFRRTSYGECLEALDKAIGGDHAVPGHEMEWRFHQMKGVVRLGFYTCEEGLLDPARAQAAFLAAARYAEAGNPEDAAKAFLAAGWSAFVEGKFQEALKHTDQAVALDAGLTEALFQAAKFRMAFNAPQEALPLLRRAVEQEPAYLVKAAADGDFQRYGDDVVAFFEAMRKEQFNLLAPKVRQALAEAEKRAKTVREVEECREMLDRWRDLFHGSRGLLDLMNFARGERLQKEVEKVEKAYERGTARMRKAWRVEKSRSLVERLMEETFREEGIVEPKGWFSKSRAGIVKETRLVKRMVEVDCHALVNELGDVIRIPLVHIPAGNFIMGSIYKYPFAGGPDVPSHKVTITNPFEMMAYPVTQGLWEAVMGSNPSTYKGRDLPVEHVRWTDARSFVGRLNRMVGADCYRLPTEAEWEYACRAGSTTPQYGELDDIAWHDGNSQKKTHPVGKKEPNAWGLYDMLGNVWEWCEDWYGEDYYRMSPKRDPKGPAEGEHHVLRGGGWNNFPWIACAAYRGYLERVLNKCLVGFRCVKD